MQQMFTNVISYARSKNFQTELEKSNRRDQLYIARVYLPFLEVIYVQLSVGANILCRVAEQKQVSNSKGLSYLLTILTSLSSCFMNA